MFGLAAIGVAARFSRVLGLHPAGRLLFGGWGLAAAALGAVIFSELVTESGDAKQQGDGGDDKGDGNPFV
jgi:hypothetical protein